MCQHPVSDRRRADPTGIEQLRGKTLLLVICGGKTREDILSLFKRLGLRLLCLDVEKKEWACKYISEWIIGPAQDKEQALETLREHFGLGEHGNLVPENTDDKVPLSPTSHLSPSLTAALSSPRRPPFDAVYSYDEFGVETASWIAESLGLHCIPHDIVSVVRDKYSFRALCQSHGIRVPRHFRGRLDQQDGEELASGREGARKALEERLRATLREKEMTFPLVFKPTKGGGSRLVRKCWTLSELCETVREFYMEAKTQMMKDFHLTEEDCDQWMVEEFIPGNEVDVDCIVQEGQLLFLSISDNKGHNDKEIFFMEKGGSCPSVLPSESQDALRTLTSDVLRMFGNRFSGVIHFEAKVAHREAFPIELNLRIGGAETYTMVKTAWDVDLAEAAVMLAFGLPLPPTKYPSDAKRHAASINYVPDWKGKGRLGPILVDSALYRDPSFVKQVFYFGQGDVLRCPPANFDYLGWCVAKGPSPDIAEENLGRLTRLVSFSLSPL